MGKIINLSLGAVSLILGIVLLVNNYQGTFVVTEQLLPLSFVCLGLALFFAAYVGKETKS